MTEREALEQKSFEDLIEIAVAFNLVDREKAVTMNPDQLISLIATEEEPKAAKKPARKTSAKKETATKSTTKKTKKTEEPKEDKVSASEEEKSAQRQRRHVLPRLLARRKINLLKK